MLSPASFAARPNDPPASEILPGRDYLLALPRQRCAFKVRCWRRNADGSVYVTGVQPRIADRPSRRVEMTLYADELRWLKPLAGGAGESDAR